MKTYGRPTLDVQGSAIAITLEASVHGTILPDDAQGQQVEEGIISCSGQLRKALSAPVVQPEPNSFRSPEELPCP